MNNIRRGTVQAHSFGRPAYLLYRLAWLGLDWLYPPQCAGCEKSYTRWCRVCQEQVRWIRDPVCARCGGSIPVRGICSTCANEPPSYTAMRSCAFYEGPIRQAIQKLKFEGNIALGEALARPMIEILKRTGWEIGLVVPVPSSLARRKMRGYNQASLLALPVALGIGVSYRPQGLIKRRDSRSQVGLSAAERRLNVLGAFLADRELVAGRSVLVIDDIRTSGSTMEACAKTLKEQDARQVFGLTLARAVL